MANNLDNIKTDAEQYIDPLGAPGSILAENHQQIVKDILTNVGKYVGAPFKAHKQLSVFPAGSMSWESKALNTTTQFVVKTAKLTSDLNNFELVLNTLQQGDLLRFKDFKGRSVFLTYIEHEQNTDVTNNSILEITVQGFSENINYTYQDVEILDCVFEVFQQKASSSTNTSDLLNDGSDGTSFYVEEDEMVDLAFDGLEIKDLNDVFQFVSDSFLNFGEYFNFNSIQKRIILSNLIAKADIINTFQLNQRFVEGLSIWDDTDSNITKKNLLIRSSPNNVETSNSRFYDLVAYGRNVGGGWKGGIRLICDTSGVGETVVATIEPDKMTVLEDLVVQGLFTQNFVNLQRLSHKVLTCNGFSTGAPRYNIDTFRTGADAGVEDRTFAGTGSGWTAVKKFILQSLGNVEKTALELRMNASGDVEIRAIETFKPEKLNLSNLGSYPDDATASSNGVQIGFAYVNSTTGAIHRRLT